MSVNKYLQNVLVLPEDDAMRQIANGFLLHPDVRLNKVQITPLARGWLHAQDAIANTYGATLTKHPQTHLVVLIDFDGHEDRPYPQANTGPVFRPRVYPWRSFGSREPQTADRPLHLRRRRPVRPKRSNSSDSVSDRPISSFVSSTNS